MVILQILSEGERQCLKDMRRNNVTSYHGLRERDIIECKDNSDLGRMVLEAAESKREAKS